MSEAMEERRALKDRVLEAALMHAAFDGWSRKTLLNAAADVGVEPATARRLFPQGGDSLLDWLDDWADRRMMAALEGEDLLRLPVRRRIARLVRARLEAFAPHREALRRAAVARSLPTSIGTAGRSIWRTVDLMWQLAGMPGGAGEGWSWYTRRASLAGVLVSTYLYWFEDPSDDHADTWAFLERRIEDVMRIGKARGRLQDMFEGLTGLRRQAP
ncbi:MAG TPA: COQ9 family protein [Geminicoccaceae bacterium]|nr:COQ9 family protein [Geminicoccaceae bacterium]